ncbi:hypothetical protein RFI_08888 [Reticulomyxa filosa]|uniref:Uncharacterized protein n=1 Tax=Reticulomyxa filosa TaxID=46433 RepID=X6NSD4_RETFI|nr:hypothetical protein RFI_08888 [Reticulomyxa filosa]|eukprot:ETO28247.1 hypothetical protein RFI_08888 [Reticulomyxa filosa]
MRFGLNATEIKRSKELFWNVLREEVNKINDGYKERERQCVERFKVFDFQTFIVSSMPCGGHSTPPVTTIAVNNPAVKCASGHGLEPEHGVKLETTQSTVRVSESKRKRGEAYERRKKSTSKERKGCDSAMGDQKMSMSGETLNSNSISISNPKLQSDNGVCANERPLKHCNQIAQSNVTQLFQMALREVYPDFEVAQMSVAITPTHSDPLDGNPSIGFAVGHAGNAIDDDNDNDSDNDDNDDKTTTTVTTAIQRNHTNPFLTKRQNAKAKAKARANTRRRLAMTI